MRRPVTLVAIGLGFGTVILTLVRLFERFLPMSARGSRAMREDGGA